MGLLVLSLSAKVCSFVTERPFEEVESENLNPPKSSEIYQDAQRRWTYCTHEGQPGAGRHHRREGGLQGPMRQAPVGLPQGTQPSRPGEQAVLHTRQKDGQGLRKRTYACIHDVEVLVQPSGEDRGVRFSTQAPTFYVFTQRLSTTEIQAVISKRNRILVRIKNLYWKLVSVYGTELDRHLYRCLLSQLPARANAPLPQSPANNKKDSNYTSCLSFIQEETDIKAGTDKFT